MEEEIWKVYKKTEKTVWEISNYGRVKKNGDIYECKINNLGYLYFSSNLTVHHAVALCFISNPENKPCVDHIDTNRLNNHVNNLRWCTYKEKEYKFSEETRHRMSEAHKGRHFSEETRRKMSIARKGRKFTDVHKQAISEGKKRKNKERQIYVLMDTGEWRRFV